MPAGLKLNTFEIFSYVRSGFGPDPIIQNNLYLANKLYMPNVLHHLLKLLVSLNDIR